MNTNITYKRELSDFLFLSLISPFFALWKLFQAKNERFIIVGSVLAMGFFGAFFAYPEGSDGHTHYLRSLEFYTSMNFSEFGLETWNILMQNPSFGVTDIYIHILSFLSNSIFGLPKSLHFFAGLVLGYFIAKSLLLVLGKNLNILSWKNGLFIFITLLLIHSVQSLNAIRISTGVWVLFYGACGYYFTRNFKFLLFFVLAAQIHLAFTVMAIPAIVAFFLANKKWLAIAIWAISFFVQLTFIDVSSFLPETEVVDNKTKFYVYEEQVLQDFRDERAASAGNWYAVYGPRLYFGVAINVAILGLLLIYFSSRDSRFNYMFCGTIMFYAFANVVPFIPSLQGRLINVVSIFLLFAVLHLFLFLPSVNLSKFQYYVFKFSIFGFSVLSIPYLLKSISHILSTTEIFFIAAPMVSFLLEVDISIRDLVGYII